MSENCRKKQKLEEGTEGESLVWDGTVTVVIPVHNCQDFIGECLQSVMDQSYEGKMEVSIFADGCTDDTVKVCKAWKETLEKDPRFTVVIQINEKSIGAGPARNRAIRAASGELICLQDADDIMEPARISEQVLAWRSRPDALIGSRFTRVPADATERYARWCNSLTDEQAFLHRFRELPIIQPTWFFQRETWARVGGYPETEDIDNDFNASWQDVEALKDDILSTGTSIKAEDLRFFYKHLNFCKKNGIEGTRALHIVPKALLKYRYLSSSTSWKTPRRLIFQIKVKALEHFVVADWEKFTIWGAGRDGKDFFKMLSDKGRTKVKAMCDVDPVKIRNGYHHRDLKTVVPVVHFSNASPPIVCCVPMDRGGEFEANLRSLNLVEGVDYFHFS